jgi:hypothetical protein
MAAFLSIAQLADRQSLPSDLPLQLSATATELSALTPLTDRMLACLLDRRAQ